METGNPPGERRRISRFWGQKLVKLRFQFTYAVTIFVLLGASTFIIWLFGTLAINHMVDAGVVTGRQAVEDLRVLNRIIGQLSVFSLALVFGLSLVFSHFIAGPIYRFEKTLEGMRDGDLTMVVRLRTRDEFKELADLFNQMLGIVFIYCGLYLIKKENTDYQFSILAKNRALHKKNLEIEKQKKEIADIAELLQRQKGELTELNALKNKLFSVIAHDLKSPIYALHNLFRNMQQYDLPAEDIKTMLPDVVNDLNFTTGLMENLLQWARSQMQSEAVNRQMKLLMELLQIPAYQIPHLHVLEVMLGALKSARTRKIVSVKSRFTASVKP